MFARIMRNTLQHSANLMHYKPLFSFKQSNILGSKKDLYTVLNVDKQANQDEIKKAYYKLAQKFHPDRNPSPDAKEKFAEISNAYETLGDEKKRKIYDQVGLTGDEQNMGGFGGEGGNPFENFANMWGAAGQQGGANFQEDFFGDFENFFQMGQGGQRASKGQDLFMNIEIDFMESIQGTTKQVKFERKGVCNTCNGNRCKPGTAPTRCSACGGKGTVNFRQGQMTVQMTCSKCRGVGTSIKHPCETCNGSGVARQTAQENITIPPGINTGQNLRMTGKGNHSESGGRPGDLLVKVFIKPDPYFTREGYDIYTTSYITISEAVLGHKVSVNTLYGSQQIPVKPGMQHGEHYVLAGQGIPKLPPNQGQKGDHHVVFKIHIPKTLDANTRKIFEQLNSIETKIDPKLNFDYTKQEAYQKQYQQHSARTQQQQQKQQQQKQKQGEDDDEEPSGQDQGQEDMFAKFRNMWR